jgi:hypothetical protein
MIRGWQSVVFLERNDRTLSGVLFVLDELAVIIKFLNIQNAKNLI